MHKVLSLPAIKSCLPFFLGKAGEPLYLSVLVHTEKVQDKETFEQLLRLGKALPFKPSACVMTPANPFIRSEMGKAGVSEADFSRRLRELDAFFEIGYHAHWCRPGGGGPGARTEIERAGFSLTLNDPAAIREQFLAECGWLAANLRQPKAYSAGWWFMSPAVAGLLAENGFETDSSLRRGRPDTFGGEYLPEDRMPENGVPFGLPGAGKVLEFPSVFYLHMNWWTVVRELFPLLRRNRGPRFAVLPTHDYNLKDGLPLVLENIKLLAAIPGVRFVSLAEMKRLAEAAGPVFGSEGFAASDCPACGKAPSAAVWREDSYRAAECADCGLIRLDPQPPDPGAIYGEDYYRNNYLPKEAGRLAFFRRRLGEIEELVPGKGRALDIGCGVGYFLKAAKDSGWDTAGVEPSAFAAAYARDKFGLAVTQALPAAPAAGFGLVTLWDVIAHLPDPAGCLRDLNRLTAPGGLLAITTPVRPRPVFKFASLVSRWVTSRYYLHIPQQLFHFTPATLDLTLRRAGFVPVRSEHISLPSGGGPGAVFGGGLRGLASRALHLLADRFHHRDYLLVYAKKERAL